MVPRWPKMGQDGPKMEPGGDPRGSKIALPRLSNIDSKNGYARVDLRDRFGSLFGPQDGPKLAQDGPKTGPRWPKTAPRQPQDAPRRPQDGFKTSHDDDEMLKSSTKQNCHFTMGKLYLLDAWEGPRWPQEGPRWPQDRPRWPHHGPKTALEGPCWGSIGVKLAS